MIFVCNKNNNNKGSTTTQPYNGGHQSTNIRSVFFILPYMHPMNLRSFLSNFITQIEKQLLFTIITYVLDNVIDEQIYPHVQFLEVSSRVNSAYA